MKINVVKGPEIICSNKNSMHNYFGWPSIARLQDGSLITAKNETEYIALNDKEQRFMSGEEVYVSHDELLRWLQKLPLTSAMGFKIQRDPHEVGEPIVKRPL